MKKCKVCKSEFEPKKMGQKVCGWGCAMSLAISTRAKAEKIEQVKERRADKVQREKLKSKAKWIAEAQAVFNLFIRTRDAGKPCICCGRYPNSDIGTGGAWDAGHYRSRGSAPHLRFDERNVHAQLKQCNRYNSGNIVGYHVGLIERIGLDAVEALESDQTPRKYTLDELRAIKATYSAKTKELRKDQE